MSKEWVTYRLADGSLIWGEYAFVTETEFFEDLDYPVDVIKETWVLQDSETVNFAPLWWSDEEDDELE